MVSRSHVIKRGKCKWKKQLKKMIENTGSWVVSPTRETKKRHSRVEKATFDRRRPKRRDLQLKTVVVTLS